jgi:hypothetical protein
MAGYPYTGGMYGGYSDPANNQKKTFAGPQVDTALSEAGQALANGASRSYDSYRQGVGDTLRRTGEAYDKGGLGAASGQYVRGTLADAGNALIQGVVKPVAVGVVRPALSLSRGVANFGKTLVTGDASPVGSSGSENPASSSAAVALAGSQAHPSSVGLSKRDLTMMPSHTPAPMVAETYLKENPHLAPHFQQKYGYLPNGINYSQGDDGSRVYTVGTPGQDGYGKMVVKPGTRTEGNNPARGQSAGNTGLSISGPDDAVARLNRPVGGPGSVPTGRMIDPESPDYSFLRPGGGESNGMPKYLGPESGLGWQTRLGLYREQVDAYNRATGNAVAMDLEAMRESGAGNRALLQAKGVNDSNDIARQRLAGDMQLNQSRMGTEQIVQQKGLMDLDNQKTIRDLNNKLISTSDPKEQRAIHRQILALHGSPDNQKYQIVTREEPDPNIPGNTIKTPYVIDQDNPANTYKVGGEGNVRATEAPEAAVEYLKKNPGQAQFFKQKYGYLPPGF